MSVQRVIRGIRDRIPGGHILGRKSAGDGAVEPISISDLTAAIVNIIKGNGGTSGTGALSKGTTILKASDIGAADGFGFSIGGLMSDGEFLGSAVWGFDISFPSTAHTDSVTSTVPATADAVFDMKVGGATVGTITFAAGSMTGVVDWSGGYTLAAGTPLYLYAPAVHDTTLSMITGTVYGDV